MIEWIKKDGLFQKRNVASVSLINQTVWLRYTLREILYVTTRIRHEMPDEMYLAVWGSQDQFCFWKVWKRTRKLPVMTFRFIRF